MKTVVSHTAQAATPTRLFHSSALLQRNVYQVNIVLRMCVVLVDGGGAKAVQNFVSLKIAAISVLAVILHPAWPCPFYTPAELAERPRRFRNFQCFYPPAVRLSYIIWDIKINTINWFQI